MNLFFYFWQNKRIKLHVNQRGKKQNKGFGPVHEAMEIFIHI